MSIIKPLADHIGFSSLSVDRAHSRVVFCRCWFNNYLQLWFYYNHSRGQLIATSLPDGPQYLTDLREAGAPAWLTPSTFNFLLQSYAQAYFLARPVNEFSNLYVP